jgi:putative tricarboxylic transport membrane protein
MVMNRKDVASGAFFVLVGAFYGFTAWKNLPIGQTLNMGPGYFPLVLSTLLVILGLAVVVRGLATRSLSPFGAISWRGLLFLTLATLFFATFFRPLGMLPSVFITTFLASLSSAQIKPAAAALISLSLALFCVIVFHFGLDLPAPIFGTWFRY